jgi:hypothetical protein
MSNIASRRPSTPNQAGRRAALRRTPHLLALEQRFMFDGAAVADAAHTAGDATALAKIVEVPAAVEVRAADPSRDQGRKEAVLVDTSVAGYKTLEAGIAAGIAIVEFDGSKDGLAQVANWAAGQSGYDAIHVLSHGSEASLRLGTTVLTASSLNDAQVRSELAQLGHAMKADGDLLLYGCSVAAGTDGLQFLAALSDATGADVQASTDPTGNAAQGGDWVLERATGSVDAASLHVDGYTGLLASAVFTDESGNTSGAGTKTYTDTVGSSTLQISATAEVISRGADHSFFVTGTSCYLIGYHAADATETETSVTFSLQGGESFDLSSFNAMTVVTDATLTISTNKGGSVDFGVSAAPSGNNFSAMSSFQGITSFTITKSGGGVFSVAIDDIFLDNITAAPAAPTVSGVSSSTTDGAYKAGDTISIQVGFSEAVTVTGTPQLTLETGSTDRTINYVSGSGTSSLTFSYTVQAGDTSADLDYLSTTALVLNGGTIKSTANSTDATLTLASPGAAGSLGANKALVIDTTAPTTTVATSSLSADTGSSSSDFITKTASQTLSGTLSANVATGESVKVSLDNGNTWASATATVGQNTWSLAGQTLAGSNTLKVKVVDAAGNDGTVYSQAYTLDTSAPGAPTVNSQSIYSLTPTITGTATLGSGESLSVSVGGASYNVTPSGGNWSLDLASATPASGTLSLSYGTTYSVTATVTDTAGNASSDATSSELVITSGSPPTTTVSTASLSADTGSSATDFITKTASQTISGTLSANLAAGEKVEVSYDNGSSWTDASSFATGSSSWSTTATLSGSNTFKARVSNASGSSTAFSHSYSLDTTAPAITFSSLALSADTGSSSTDFITATAGQTVTATLSGAPAGGDIVYGSLDGGNSWTDISSKVSGTTLSWNGVTLSGSNTLKLKVTDAAGNDGTVASQAYVLDSTAPATTIAWATFSSDTGSSGSDFITRTADQTLSGMLSAPLAAGESVMVSMDNGGTWANATATVGQNNWSLAGLTLAGSDTLLVKVVDQAGNSGTAYSHSYTVDSTKPDAPTVGTVSTTSLKPTLYGWCGLAEVSVTVGGATYNVKSTAGQWSLDLASATPVSGTLSLSYDKSYDVVATVTDAAGNSASDLTVGELTIALPPQPKTVVSKLTLWMDVGSSDNDFITNIADQTVDGTLSAALAEGERVEVSIDGGKSWVTASSKVGSTSWATGVVLQAGSNVLQARVTGPGGSGTVYTHEYTLDTTPSTLRFNNVALSSDTGSSSGDLITKDAAQTITATLSDPLAAGDKVWGSLDGKHWTELTSKVSGTRLSWDGVMLDDGLAIFDDDRVILHYRSTLQLMVKDIAGNSGAVTTREITLDTSAPAIGFSDLSLVGGTLKDGILVTTSAAQTIGAKLSAAPAVTDVVYGSLDNGKTWTDITGEVSGTTLSWSGVTLGSSAGTIKLKVVDIAGNESTVSSQAYRVEAVPTSVQSSVIAPVADTPKNTSTTFLFAQATFRPQSLATSLDRPTATAELPFDNRPQNNETATTGPKPTLTSPGLDAFQVAVIARAPGGGDALVVNAPMRDVSIEPRSRLSVTIPSDSFASTNPDAVVTLTATRADGQPLPGWLIFNARTGTFEGAPPPNFRGEVVLKVTAQDKEGRRVVQTFKIVFGNKGSSQDQGTPTRTPMLGAQLPPELDAAHRVAVLGRSGLGEQLQAARGTGADRLAALAAGAKAAAARRA